SIVRGGCQARARVRGRLPPALRRGAHESAVRRGEQASAGTPGETVSAHQERPLCGVRGNGPAAPPSGRIAGDDHVPDRLLPVVVPEVAGGNPLARGPADRVCSPTWVTGCLIQRWSRLRRIVW